MTRDDQGNLYVVGTTLSDTPTPSTLVRFNATGQTYDVWNAGGVAIAVTPAGDAAYVLSATTETIGST
jgi:hypothetical protein